MFHFSYQFFVKRLETCFKRYINVIYYYYCYYLFIVKRFDHVIGKRYISTCYVCMLCMYHVRIYKIERGGERTTAEPACAAILNWGLSMNRFYGCFVRLSINSKRAEGGGGGGIRPPPPPRRFMEKKKFVAASFHDFFLWSFAQLLTLFSEKSGIWFESYTTLCSRLWICVQIISWKMASCARDSILSSKMKYLLSLQLKSQLYLHWYSILKQFHVKKNNKIHKSQKQRNT